MKITIAALIGLCLVFSFHAVGQYTTASLAGTVVDASGGTLPDAQVTARNTDTGFSQKTTTDAAGAFLFSRLPVGNYELRVEKPGFTSYVQSGITLTASAMQYFESELEKAIVLTLFIPLIMSSGGNSGSQATSLLIRSLALRDVALGDWWRVALRELPTGVILGVMLGAIGVVRIVLWQKFGLYDYGDHWVLVAATVAAALVGVVAFGSVAGSMLPFALQRLGFDPASASAPFVATLVDVTGLMIYFSVALVFLRGSLL